MSKRKILVTSALPYANGDIHIGHLVEYLQTDFWVRFQKMSGHECLYMCADDTHGTPVMISARQAGIEPEQLIEEKRALHMKDFAEFEIEFDHYSSTHSDENRELCEKIYASMEKNDCLSLKAIEQAYCDQCQMFLPDRFVKGTCPNKKCAAPNQYGDSCDVCSNTHSPTEMVDAVCTVCGSTPGNRKSEHIFFKLNLFREFLESWVREHTPNEVANKLDEWLKDELRDWDISRDAPYFGFQIPGHENKFFYVWVDAPIGYMSATWQWCKKNGRDLDEFWKDKSSELYHFIGKDIVYFHTLFWPAMLKNAGYKTPDQIFVHGFLTVNGEKMSKSKGTFINARTYLDYLDPMYLRYYYACKLNSSLEDIDLSFADFISRVNSDLVGKITNLGSRGLQMIHKKLDGKLGKISEDGLPLLKLCRSKASVISSHYENRDFNKAILEIRGLAEQANKYFDEKEPWNLVKTDAEATRQVLTDIVNVFRLLAIYLKPVLPAYVQRVEKLLKEQPYTWQDIDKNIENCEVSEYEHLAKRIEQTKVDAMVQSAIVKDDQKEQVEDDYEPLADEISIDDLFKADLRVAKIVEAEGIEKANKLIRLKVDLGFEQREIIAGIKQAYKPEDLIGRLTVIVANLKPRKMKFGVSNGMVMAAGPGGKEIFLLSPDDGAKPGQRIG